jgi:hypothetical protein
MGDLHRSTACSVSLSLHRAALSRREEGCRRFSDLLPPSKVGSGDRPSIESDHTNAQAQIVKQHRKASLSARPRRDVPIGHVSTESATNRTRRHQHTDLDPPLSQLQTRRAERSRAENRHQGLCNIRRPTGPLSSESCTGGKELSRRVVPAYLRWNLAGRRMQQSLSVPSSHSGLSTGSLLDLSSINPRARLFVRPREALSSCLASLLQPRLAQLAASLPSISGRTLRHSPLIDG